MKFLMKIAVITAFIVIGKSAYADVTKLSSENGLVTSLSTYSRLTLPLKKNSEFKAYSNKEGEIILEVDGSTIEGLENLSLSKDERILDIKEIQSNDKSIKKLFIKLAGDNYEYFSYTQNIPPSIVVDVWPSNNKKKEKKPVKRKIASIPPKVVEKESQKALPFIDPEKNFFVKLPTIAPRFVYNGVNFNTEKEIDPGSGWEWSATKSDEPAALNFSLAKKLFKKKQYALCIKTIQFARRDFRQSPYFDEMEYMEALAYRYFSRVENNKALFNKSVDLLKELMLRTQKNKAYLPFSNKIRIHFAAEAYRNNDWLEAISHFEFITNAKNIENDPDYFGLMQALSEAYVKINQFRRAERILRSLVTNNSNKTLAGEAAFRIGNLLANEDSYTKANEAFIKALQEYPKHESIRQEAYYNLGEVNFQIKNYEMAEKYFKEFIRLHPSNAEAGFAYFRIGEIGELFHKNRDLAKKSYLEAINRFPFSIADTFARIRLSRLDFSDEKDIGFQIKFLTEIVNSKETNKELKNMAREILISYHQKSNEPEQAVNLSKMGMSEVNYPEYEIYEKLYMQSLFATLKKYNENKEYKNALKLYSEYKSYLERFSDDVYKEISLSYKGLNLLSTSSLFLAKYVDKVEGDKNREIASVNADKKETNFLEAKINYLKGRCEWVLENMAPYNNFEAFYYQSLCLNKLKRFDEAKQMAEKALSVDKKSENEQYLVDLQDVRVSWAERRKDYVAMEKFLNEAQSNLKNKNERFMFLFADSFWYQQKHSQAVEAYKNAIENFPKSTRLDRSVYRQAMSFISLGDRISAVKILTELQNKSPNIWTESAKRELELIDWEKKYSVIIGDSPPSGLGLKN